MEGLALLRALRALARLLALPVALSAPELPAARDGAVTARVCSHCAAVLPAGSHPNRSTCSPECKSAIYRQRRRERRREEARERPTKRPARPAPPPIDTDAITAALTVRERAIMNEWRAER